jgi:hypothetical protein
LDVIPVAHHLIPFSVISTYDAQILFAKSEISPIFGRNPRVP